jgi:Tfp pilus assembly PilM family ATPase
MAKSQETSIGLEYDNAAIHCVRLQKEKTGGNEYCCEVEQVEEICGDFAREDDLVDGLKSIKDTIGIRAGENVVTCVGGKQVYTQQLRFRILPGDEMKSALLYEIRKNLPFEATGSSVEFQYLGERMSAPG